MQKSSMKLQGIELQIHLGWSEQERQKRQTISLQLDLYFPEPPAACETDNLADTLCYDHLINNLKNHIENRPFKLIEHLAKEIYKFTKKSTNSEIVIKVHVTKKPLIEALTQGVMFSYGDEVPAW